MKKSIKAELISLAHKILQLKEGTSYEEMTEQTRALYEKLMVLSYAEKMEKLGQPTIGLSQIEDSLQEKVEEVEEEVAPVVELAIETPVEKEPVEVPEVEKIEVPVSVPEPPKVKTPALFTGARATGIFSDKVVAAETPQSIVLTFSV